MDVYCRNLKEYAEMHMLKARTLKDLERRKKYFKHNTVKLKRRARKGKK